MYHLLNPIQSDSHRCRYIHRKSHYNLQRPPYQYLQNKGAIISTETSENQLANGSLVQSYEHIHLLALQVYYSPKWIISTWTKFSSQIQMDPSVMHCSSWGWGLVQVWWLVFLCGEVKYLGEGDCCKQGLRISLYLT